jgi:hypothetical protein
MASSQSSDSASSSYAEVINSTKGKIKINIDGFLYIKDKNRDDLYYWVCERKGLKESKCTARATTICIGHQHKIRKFDAKQHNHAPEASKLEVLKACVQMKELAQISNDQPAQIISNVIATTSREIQPCLPRKYALRQQIKRAKRVCNEEKLWTILNYQMRTLLHSVEWILQRISLMELKEFCFSQQLKILNGFKKANSGLWTEHLILSQLCFGNCTVFTRLLAEMLISELFHWFTH